MATDNEALTVVPLRLVGYLDRALGVLLHTHPLTEGERETMKRNRAELRSILTAGIEDAEQGHQPIGAREASITRAALSLAESQIEDLRRKYLHVGRAAHQANNELAGLKALQQIENPESDLVERIEQHREMNGVPALRTGTEG